MKRFIITAVLFPLFGLTQVEDTTCIYARWIGLRPGNINSAIFCLDPNLPIEKDFIFYVKKIVDAGKINIYSEKQLEDGSFEWSYIDYQEAVLKAKTDTQNKNNWFPYFSMLGADQDNPIVDEFGDPIIETDATGGLHFVYPEREVYPLKTSDIHQIVSKEIKNSNKQTDEPDFIPSDIGFFMSEQEGARPREVFWINIEELKNNITAEEYYPWLSSINNLNYKGTLLRQVTCEYMNTNYSESEHPIVLQVSDSCTCSITIDMIRTHANYVLKIPGNCEKGINVYFDMGGTQTSINITELMNDSEKSYERFSIANKGDLKYATFYYTGPFQVHYRACHIYKEFRINIR